MSPDALSSASDEEDRDVTGGEKEVTPPREIPRCSRPFRNHEYAQGAQPPGDPERYDTVTEGGGRDFHRGLPYWVECDECICVLQSILPLPQTNQNIRYFCT